MIKSNETLDIFCYFCEYSVLSTHVHFLSSENEIIFILDISIFALIFTRDKDCRSNFKFREQFYF